MATYNYQGIRFRGTKFYYNPFHKIKDRFGDLEGMFDSGFLERSAFLKTSSKYRPFNWFYDDGRKFPHIIFGEDVILDHWNKRFPELHCHVHSFISKDKEFYTHPRDRWIDEQVALMREKQLNYADGFRAMERRHQKNLYISQLERQHQLQQVQEYGDASLLDERTWFDTYMFNETTIRTRLGVESAHQFARQQLEAVVKARIEEFQMRMVEFENQFAKDNLKLEDQMELLEYIFFAEPMTPSNRFANEYGEYIGQFSDDDSDLEQIDKEVATSGSETESEASEENADHIAAPSGDITREDDDPSFTDEEDENDRKKNSFHSFGFSDNEDEPPPVLGETKEFDSLFPLSYRNVIKRAGPLIPEIAEFDPRNFRQWPESKIRALLKAERAAKQKALQARYSAPVFRKISLVDFHPAVIDQKLVMGYIRESEENAQYFDMTWFAFDKDALYEIHTYDKDTFLQLMTEVKETEARWDRFDEIKPEYWKKLYEARLAEQQAHIEDYVIPGHPNKFPKFLFEEETRKIRAKDKEFAELMSKAGNKEADKWYRARSERKQKAHDTLDDLVRDMDARIQQKEAIE